MPSLPYDNVITGGFFLAAGLLALVRQSLLEPHSPNYPKAPTWLRHCMFAYAASLIFTGLQLIWTFVADHLPKVQAANSFQMLAGVLCVYNAAMLFNILRQRYPAETWERLNRINDRLFCNQTPARRWLSK